VKKRNTCASGKGGKELSSKGGLRDPRKKKKGTVLTTGGKKEDRGSQKERGLVHNSSGKLEWEGSVMGRNEVTTTGGPTRRVEMYKEKIPKVTLTRPKRGGGNWSVGRGGKSG